jgi:cytochrome bd-type quinol oxidase subunit 2
LVAIAIVRSWLGTRRDSMTVDEAWHVVAGVEYIREQSYRLNPEHPPLVKLAAGAAVPPTFVIPPRTALSGKGAERDFTAEVFFAQNDFRVAHQHARIGMWALNTLLLLLLGAVTWHALSPAWAVGTIALLALEPTVSAHLPVVMTDLPVALTLTTTALVAGLLVTTWSWGLAVGLGLTMGLTLTTKHSALPGLAGIGLFCTAAACWRAYRTPGPVPQRTRVLAQHALQLVLSAVIAVGMLWAAYSFRFHASPDGLDDFNRTMTAKVGDLQVAHWRALISWLDEWRLLPRSYLWGLADTVRAGVEGRGQNVHLLWGVRHVGAPPWYTWPSFVLAKVPLAMLGLMLVGLASLRRATSERSRWVVASVLAMALIHLLALRGSQGTYAGVRHALPVVTALAVMAGAVAHLGWQAGSRPARAVFVAATLLTLAMTIREPRLWEYHNELAGGTREAWRSFGNEGLDLGQRAYELADFHDAEMARDGMPVYTNYWFGEEQARALGIPIRRRVPDLTDTNRAGVFEGWFIYEIAARDTIPEADWDPAEIFADLTPVARLGYVEVWRGRQMLPKARADALYHRLVEYVHADAGTDWRLVVTKAAEILGPLPFHVGAAVEQGNAYLRLGDREGAARAYQRPIDEADRGFLDALTRTALEERIRQLDGNTPLADIRPVPNPWME